MQKVLIIDENQEERELLKAILEEEYDVAAASDIKEGITLAETGKHSLIFLSAGMSDTEDFTVLKELQGKIMPWHIPVILLLDQEDVKKEEKGLSLGAADYIVKPVYPMVVKARAHAHVSLYQYKKKEERESAMVDSLTGVASKQRYELNGTLKWQEAVRLNVPISICMIDLDKFRTYNERYGFPAGDKVLTQVAGIVSAALKRSTDFFARYGGDKFIALILGGEGEIVFEHLKNIRKSVEKLHIPHWGSVSEWITVSIGGVTTVPQVGDSYDTYFEMAENMLAEAKKSGRNRIAWTKEDKELLSETN
ncbi:MAG: diguanylate cyclase [Lachnospiraceae bacterium]